MNRFLDLFRHRTPPPPGKIFADERSDLFPGVVEASLRLTPWGAESEIPAAGPFLLVGAATWSGYDMALLDAIESAPTGPDVIGVFDLQQCQSVEDLQRRIPGIGLAYQTPVVGLWQDGRLAASGWGHEGRKLAFAVCGLDPSKMDVLLDPKHAYA